MSSLQRKRILVIANRFYPQLGGAELNTFMQAQELGRYFEVDVITPIRDRNPRREVVDRIHIFRAYDWRNPFNRFPSMGARTLCPQVFARVMLGQYALVHCFPALNHNNLLALLASKLRGIPIFLSNFDAFDYGQLLKDGVTYEDFSRLTLTSRQIDGLERFTAIFTISNRETELLRQANPKTFLSTVPVIEKEYQYEPDTEGFRRRFGIGPSEPLVLCLGRVSHIKGQDILLRTLALMDQRIRPKVMIAGRTDYEPEYEALLRGIIHDNRIEDRVVLTGPLSREDALAALRACDVHVLPVRFMNSGAVVVETWASGRPVLQSDHVDPNYVVEGENGYTFDIENPQELAEKLSRLLSDSELRQKMGKNGRKLVKEKFLYSHLIAQYLDAYRTYGGVSPE